MKPKFSRENGTFVIENYHEARPFSSFLPGIAGEFGKPMWVFYTNRGQGIASFGVKNRDGAMLEFYPANKAYTQTPLQGFRTFLRFRQAGQWRIYEPFRVHPEPGIRQIMRVRAHEVELEEIHSALGLKIQVVYFNAPNEGLPVLVRQVRLDYHGKRPFPVEVVDGLPQVVPFGLNEWLLKHMSRTMEAFAEVPHAEEGLPFFKLKTEPSDRPEIRWIDGGFFAFTQADGGKSRMIVDRESLFGPDTSCQEPIALRSGKSLAKSSPAAEAQFACAFSWTPLTLGPRQPELLNSYYGQADTWEEARTYRQRVQLLPSYADAKREENAAVMDGVTGVFGLHTSAPELDAYARNTYLDNVLRGGQPLVLSNGSDSQMFHCFSRKHGDMERDYNFFELAPTPFSQGNGNFRDVNQNRRSETLMHPGLGAGNVETFFNLLQLDGYNPLVIQFEKFQVGNACVRPSDLFESLLKSSGSREDAFAEMTRTLARAKKFQDATHGEGFWVDHWTYNLDLLEGFAAVYPDQLKHLLTVRRDFTYFDNDYVVQPRSKKYVLRADGAVRQLHAVVQDPEKAQLLRRRKSETRKVRTQNGQGVIYETSLLDKILTLLAVKAASLDPFGIGIEMEAEKPGWCDALNGLPGLIGSSVNESFELRRWVQFVQEALASVLGPGQSHSVLAETATLMKAVQETLALARADDFFRTWDTLASLRETFRERTKLGVSGDQTTVSREDIQAFLDQLDASLTAGLKKAFTSHGLCVTYFINEITRFEKLPASTRSSDQDPEPVTYVRALAFEQTPLSYFLEGPVHALRAAQNAAAARSLYQAVKRSDLYDRKLKMYKLNVPLDKESYEIGRNKVFPPGWLENESIFLHMHYKFLLEVLRSGLAAEFYAEMKNGIVAFLDPAVYGRSPLENSSFIASSRFPDPRVHGTGFVARLSGSTAEWLSMVFYMGLGPAPFKIDQGRLRFEPMPVLAGWLFSKKADGDFAKGTFGLKLFGKTWLVYHNPTRQDTFTGAGLHPVRYHLAFADGRNLVHEGSFLPETHAKDLRDGKLDRVTIDLH